MTIRRQARIFTKGGGLYTGQKITISLDINQPEGKVNWFVLPSHLMILQGIIKVEGRVRIVGRQVYFGNLPIPNIQSIHPTAPNLFQVENFGGCFPKLIIYVKKGSQIQLRLDQVYAKQPSGAVLQNPDAYVARFQL